MDAPGSQEATDEALVLVAQSDPTGEEGRRAASILLGRYARRVSLWCWRYVRDEDRAMDLAQDVLLAAYRNLGSFRVRSRFSSWLFTIARNHCLDEMARRRTRTGEEVDLELLPSPNARAEGELEAEQDHRRLLELLLRHLEPVEARALWLTAVERMPVDDVTRMLKLENATGARGLLQRARRRLRAGLTSDEMRSGT